MIAQIFFLNVQIKVGRCLVFVDNEIYVGYLS
jgi:hypothetical protein